MSDLDQLQALGQQLAADIVGSYGAKSPGTKLVFLTMGVPVPFNPGDPVDSASLVQPLPSNPAQLMVNATQMQTWLSMNFDSPYAITPGDGLVLGKDSSHGSASRIYSIAATSAVPLGASSDPAWTRIDGEIAAALRSLGPPEAPKSIVCEPGDWPLPSANAGYWVNFDSTDTKSTSTQTTVLVPQVRPQYWMVRSLASAAIASPPPPAPPPADPPPAQTQTATDRFRLFARREIQRAPMEAMNAPTSGLAVEQRQTISVAAQPMVASEAVVPVNSASVVVSEVRPQMAAWRSDTAAGVVPERIDSQVLLQNFLPVQTVTTSTSSTIKIHLQHQCVTLGYYSAGQPWWDGVFLADQGWFMPGMRRGGLLPPADGGPDATYGLPISLIVVQNLSVNGQWSDEAAAALSSPAGAVGPLSLFGAQAKSEQDGTKTFGFSGMQVVALLCSALPVLPANDDPSLTPSPASTTPAPAPATPPADPPPSPAASPPAAPPTS